MAAIYKREMYGFFTNLTGAVAAAVMLLVFGLMFRYYNLYNGALTMHYTVSGSALVFYIVVPVLSMRSFAEERRQKTDQLILTAPVSLAEIVFGKYLALISMLALPLAILCTFPLIMTAFGNETVLWDYTVIGAFFLMGCAYLAVGLFISSCTENAVIAAILSIVFVFVTQMMSSVFTMISSTAMTALLFLAILSALAGMLVFVMTGNFAAGMLSFALLSLACIAGYLVRPDWFSGRTESVLRILDFSTHFSDFAGGAFSLANAVYFISYIAAGLVLTLLSLDRRRWS